MHSRSAVLFALAMAAVCGAWAAAPVIGVATTSADFQIDRTSVTGQATILDGSLIETGPAPSDLRLYEGTGMRLAAKSRGQVFRNRIVLEQGEAQVNAAKGYAVEAAGLRVQASSHSAARINMAGASRVEVAAISGEVQVTNETGVLLAQVLPGRALAFTVQPSGAAPPEKLTGVLTESKGHYFLIDKTAGVKVELVGSDLVKLVGKTVEVTGTLDTAATPAQSAAHVVKVLSARVVGSAAKAGAAAAAGAKAGTAAGVSHTAVIAGIAVAGATVAPAAIALTTDSQPVSRE